MSNLASDNALEERRRLELSDQVFARFCRIVREQAGIVLDDTKRDLVYSRLSRRLRALSMTDFKEYCDLVERNTEPEFEEFLNAITTNLTSFFRERHHFDFMSETVIPELLKRHEKDRRIRLWSAGCSTGNEPYSLSMTLLENLPASQAWDILVLATDLDTRVLDKARAGVYEYKDIESLKPAQRQRWFEKGGSGNEELVRVKPELGELIRFNQLNLMGDWPMKGPFDVIFCRNVVIYFDKDTQRRLFDRYAQLMTDGGYLFVGHSESLFRVTDRFELIGQSIYRKVY